jgi:hypothetical protein
MFHRRSEKFPGCFDDLDTENELAAQRHIIYRDRLRATRPHWTHPSDPGGRIDDGDHAAWFM